MKLSDGVASVMPEMGRRTLPFVTWTCNDRPDTDCVVLRAMYRQAWTGDIKEACCSIDRMTLGMAGPHHFGEVVLNAMKRIARHIEKEDPKAFHLGKRGDFQEIEDRPGSRIMVIGSRDYHTVKIEPVPAGYWPDDELVHTKSPWDYEKTGAPNASFARPTRYHPSRYQEAPLPPPKPKKPDAWGTW